MPFLPPNQQRQSTEGNVKTTKETKITNQAQNDALASSFPHPPLDFSYMDIGH